MRRSPICSKARRRVIRPRRSWGCGRWWHHRSSSSSLRSAFGGFDCLLLLLRSTVSRHFIPRRNWYDHVFPPFFKMAGNQNLHRPSSPPSYSLLLPILTLPNSNIKYDTSKHSMMSLPLPCSVRINSTTTSLIHHPSFHLPPFTNTAPSTLRRRGMRWATIEIERSNPRDSYQHERY